MNKLVNTVDEGLAFAKDSGFPVVVRGSFTIGKFVVVSENEDQLAEALAGALQASPTSEARIEKIEYLTGNPENSVA